MVEDCTYTLEKVMSWLLDASLVPICCSGENLLADLERTYLLFGENLLAGSERTCSAYHTLHVDFLVEGE